MEKFNFRYPRLSDPEDVAARLAESWDQEFAARAGQRRDFADGVRSRLSRWAAAADKETSRMTYERRFRDEVALRVSARLEAWVRAGGWLPAAAPETSGAAPRTC